MRLFRLPAFLLFFLLLCLRVHAQEFSSQYWHLGEVDLSDGNTLQGRVKYDLDGENLQIVQGETIKSYSAENIEAFQFTDALSKRERYFFSLPYKQANGYQKRHFFELLTDGQTYSLMAREKVVERIEPTMSPYYWGGTSTVRTMVLDYDFFLIDGKGNISMLDMRKQETALQPMKDKAQSLQNFVKVNKLDYRRPDHLSALVDYYNRLKSEDALKRRAVSESAAKTVTLPPDTPVTGE